MHSSMPVPWHQSFFIKNLKSIGGSNLTLYEVLIKITLQALRDLYGLNGFSGAEFHSVKITGGSVRKWDWEK